jgi:membrane protein EpsK
MPPTAQTQKNFVFNIFTLAANVAVGLFYTPYLVKSLGIAAYGVVPLALVINHYISVISTSLTGTLTRFYSVALGNNKVDEASKYLTSSFFALVVIIAFLTPAFILLVSNVDKIFNIPEAIVPQAKTLFTFTIISFLLSLFSSLLNITLYARNRLDLMNLVKCTRVLIKVSITVLFFESIQKNVAFIGYANIITEVVIIIFSIYLYRKTAEKEVNISFKYLQKTALVSVSTMTFWVIVHQIGDTGLYRVDNILVNKFWSSTESGILGAFTEFGTYVTSVVAVISTLFGPLILMAYSNSDHKKVKTLAMDNSLLVGAITA